MREILFSPFIVPLGGMTMALLIVVAVVWGKARQKEIEHDLEVRRMEHERQMKELEIQRIKAGGGPKD